MCNARRHPAGCACGFGPPYPPSYSATEVTEWAEEALENSSLVRRGLSEMAWDELSIEEFLVRYTAIRNSNLPRITAIDRIRELLRLRTTLEESVMEEWINVPLYRFGAPHVDGAFVEYSEGESSAEGSGWNLKVFGIGTGDTTTLVVNKSRTFVAKSGACKLVFVPVKLRVATIAVEERGRPVKRGVRAQVAPLPESGDAHLLRRGCKTLPVDACRDGPKADTELLECILSGDTSGDIHRDRRSWETDVARDVSVRLGKVVDVSALVRVRRTRRLELGFALPAGRDYRAYLSHSAAWWELPRR